MATNAARSSLLAFMDHVSTTQAEDGAEWHFTVSLPEYRLLSVQQVSNNEAAGSNSVDHGIGIAGSAGGNKYHTSKPQRQSASVSVSKKSHQSKNTRTLNDSPAKSAAKHTSPAFVEQQDFKTAFFEEQIRRESLGLMPLTDLEVENLYVKHKGDIPNTAQIMPMIRNGFFTSAYALRRQALRWLDLFREKLPMEVLADKLKLCGKKRDPQWQAMNDEALSLFETDGVEIFVFHIVG